MTKNSDDPRPSAAGAVREPAQRAAMEALLARGHGVPRYKFQRLIGHLLGPAG